MGVPRSIKKIIAEAFLEAGYDKSTWRGDAQRYWLTQVLECNQLAERNSGEKSKLQILEVGMGG